MTTAPSGFMDAALAYQRRRPKLSECGTARPAEVSVVQQHMHKVNRVEDWLSASFLLSPCCYSDNVPILFQVLTLFVARYLLAC